MDSFPKRLESLLNKKGWSKTELARRLGVTHPAVLKYWKGQMPKAENLVNMAELFGVSALWLVNGDEAPTNATGLHGDIADETFQPAPSPVTLKVSSLVAFWRTRAEGHRTIIRVLTANGDTARAAEEQLRLDELERCRRELEVLRLHLA